MALSISAWSSFVASVIGTIDVVLFAPALAHWALAFGPAEILRADGVRDRLSCRHGRRESVKTLLACVIGLALATVGVDANSGVYRFTFGDLHLADGIQFVVVVIGLFSVSEILLMLEQTHTGGGS